jgi:hypothetical protein
VASGPDVGRGGDRVSVHRHPVHAVALGVSAPRALEGVFRRPSRSDAAHRFGNLGGEGIDGRRLRQQEQR